MPIIQYQSLNVS